MYDAKYGGLSAMNCVKIAEPIKMQSGMLSWMTFLLHLFKNRIFGDKWHRFFQAG